jgi:hypothetical protein
MIFPLTAIICAGAACFVSWLIGGSRGYYLGRRDAATRATAALDMALRIMPKEAAIEAMIALDTALKTIYRKEVKS